MLRSLHSSLHSARRFLLVASIGVTGLVSHMCFAQGPLAVLSLSGPEASGASAAPKDAAEPASLAGTGKTAASTSATARGGGESVAAGTRTMVTATVRVIAAADATDTDEGYERRINSQEMEHSAGTFGDPGRFMQTLPGVVSDNDQRNDFIVRGGNPAETLFVVDSIEMPSINQLALSDTTGGFVSMIDSAAVQHTTLHTDAYDSKFDQRLSAVVEMSTRPEGPVGYHARSEFGIGGTGGSIERPLGTDGSMFVSLLRRLLPSGPPEQPSYSRSRWNQEHLDWVRSARSNDVARTNPAGRCLQAIWYPRVGEVGLISESMGYQGALAGSQDGRHWADQPRAALRLV